jgi:hypothetical protein
MTVHRIEYRCAACGQIVKPGTGDMRLTPTKPTG